MSETQLFQVCAQSVYGKTERVVLVATDRLSAFDRGICSVPNKGQVLNRLAAFWHRRASGKGIVDSALLFCNKAEGSQGLPHPNCAVMMKCEVIPVEFVMRAYATGSTRTSLWTAYENGSREFCGHVLPEGLKKNDALPRNILTPTTKEKTGDRPISLEEIRDNGLVRPEILDHAVEVSYALFEDGVKLAKEAGLILVDTKYEFGVDMEGNLRLIDEVHTPDSSRYWQMETYDSRHNSNKVYTIAYYQALYIFHLSVMFGNRKEPESADKEYIRLWYKNAKIDTYGDNLLPPPPEEIIEEASKRYRSILEKITGMDIIPQSARIEDEIAECLAACL